MDLPSLIRATERGSLSTLSRLADGEISKQQWGEYANGKFSNFPRPASIAAMARALGVTERTVLLAIAETLGLAVTDDQPLLVSMLPTEVRHLSDDAITSILQFVRLLVESADAPAKAPAPTRTGTVPAAALTQRTTASASGSLRLV